eukprot:scaffold14093_cov51-Phaeocystis_antarctica.AAC.2
MRRATGWPLAGALHTLWRTVFDRSTDRLRAPCHAALLLLPDVRVSDRECYMLPCKSPGTGGLTD